MNVLKIAIALILLVMLFGFFLLFGDYIFRALDRASSPNPYDDRVWFSSFTCEQLKNYKAMSYESRELKSQIYAEKNC